MSTELTFDERRQLDETIYKIFPEIEGYEAGPLDRVVAKLIADRERATQARMLDAMADALVEADLGLVGSAKILRDGAQKIRERVEA